MRGKKPKAAFYTLGCKVNQNETDAMTSLFKKRGYDIVDFTEEADVYVINTCTVTHLADRKSRQLIRRCHKVNPQARVVVTGCYTQVSPGDVEQIPGVSLVTGTAQKKHIIDWVEELKEKEKPLLRVQDLHQIEGFEEIEADISTERVRAYLKVEEGCEQFCSYCIIPYARGPVRSLPLEKAILEAQKIIESGRKEIVLTGIHLGAYGKDLGSGLNLEKLMQELLPLAKDVRWRLSSLEPTEVSRELLRLMTDNDNFCPHLHLPLQSGHDEILKAMKRPYTTREYREVITMVRAALPDVCITTDVMVGFPGETDEHFKAYLEFVEEMSFSRLHVFKYSPRTGTPAARLTGQITPQIKEERSRKLIRLADRLALQYASRFIGRKLDVLAETEIEKDLWEGHSANYLMLQFTNKEIKRGQIIPVELVEVKGKTCFGKAMNDVKGV